NPGLDPLWFVPCTIGNFYKTQLEISTKFTEAHTLAFFTKFAKVYEAQRFDLRFLRPFRADFSIRKSSSFFPPLIAATSQVGFAPRRAQVSPDGPRYFGGTFLPLNGLPPPRTTLRPPTKAIALSILSICFCISARCSRSISSTRFRRSMSVSTVIPDRFSFAIVISDEKTV